MKEEPQHLQSYLFTIRVWLEEIGGGNPKWHGKAQSISNGQTCYFRDWPALLAFLQKNIPPDQGDFDHEPDRNG